MFAFHITLIGCNFLLLHCTFDELNSDIAYFLFSFFLPSFHFFFFFFKLHVLLNYYYYYYYCYYIYYYCNYFNYYY